MSGSADNLDQEFAQALENLMGIQAQKTLIKASEKISDEISGLISHIDEASSEKQVILLFSTCSDEQMKNVCYLLHEQNHTDKIDLLFDSMCVLHPDKTVSYCKIAYSVYMKLKLYDKAVRSLEKQLPFEPIPEKQQQIYLDISALYYLCSKFELAFASIQNVPLSLSTIDFQVKVMREMTHYSKAIDLVSSALSTAAPADQTILAIYLAQILMDLSAYSKAELILTQYNSDNTDYHSILLQLLLFTCKTHTQAQSIQDVENRGVYFNKLIIKSDFSSIQKSKLFFELGNYYYETILPKNALECFMSSIQAVDNNSAKYKIIDLLQNLGMHQLSMQFLQKTQLNYYKTYYYHSLQLINFNKYKEALQVLEKCVQLNENFREAQILKAQCLIQLQRFQEALQLLIKLSSFQEIRIQLMLIQLNQVLARFENYSADARSVVTAVDTYIHRYYRNQEKLNPYNQLHKSPIPQRSTFMHQISFNQSVALGIINANLNNRKLQFLQQRLSQDFPVFTFQHLKDKPSQFIRVGLLLPQTTETPFIHIVYKWFSILNQNNATKIYVYAMDKQVKSPMQTHIQNSVHKYVPLFDADQFQCAKHIYDDQIQILINCNFPGVTKECQICALRPAPIQVQSFNAPGTSGASYYNYVMGDSFTIPTNYFGYYTEQIMQMSRPICYSIYSVDLFTDNELNNSSFSTDLNTKINLSSVLDEIELVSQPSTTTPPTKIIPNGKRNMKKYLQIPENAFVFGCLSKIYKLEPLLLNLLSKLLRTKENSVLLLLGYPEEASVNLSNYFLEREQKVFFLKSYNPIEQAKFTLVVDLYVDSAKMCGQHSVTGALLANIPVVCFPGTHMCQRQTGSMLSYLNVPELICTSWEDMYQKANKLANDTLYYETVKNKISKTRTKLFDLNGYLNELKEMLQIVWNQWQIGLQPICTVSMNKREIQKIDRQ
ncbi:O-linked_GlcNAc transferase [Hexamita inflata]|uniref:O-linked GlcNAc transferase n=1 Tax=Hexamita inflata TaxID=28002 RepID=A0AA86P1W3_9EUKA|nr:O-linked GlcNAc transferase [Hexamita inflata]